MLDLLILFIILLSIKPIARSALILLEFLIRRSFSLLNADISYVENYDYRDDFISIIILANWVK